MFVVKLILQLRYHGLSQVLYNVMIKSHLEYLNCCKSKAFYYFYVYDYFFFYKDSANRRQNVENIKHGFNKILIKNKLILTAVITHRFGEANTRRKRQVLAWTCGC
jgi:Ca2+/Na+ antiporter